MLTLGTQRDLTNDMLIKGIIDSVVTVNQFYNMLPFKGIQGNALAYNRELAGADQMSLVDIADTALDGINKDEQKFSRHSTELTTIIGDAQVNGLIQAVGSDYNDATAVQVAAKAKGIGRTYMNSLINGRLPTSVVVVGDGIAAATTPGSVDTTAELIAVILSVTGTVVTVAQLKLARDYGNIRGIPTPTGIIILNASDQWTAAGKVFVDSLLRVLDLTSSPTRKTSTDGPSAFDGLESFVLASNNYLEPSSGTSGDARLGYLDQIIDRVHDKDGMVDYLMMNSAGVRKITQAFRTVGTGFDMMDVKTSSGGVMQVQSYRGVPIFRNDFIGGGNLAGLSGGDGDDSVTVYAGTVDDGSFSHGICGLTALKSAGMQVQKLGARENVDADITRVKWYCGLAHFSELGLVRGRIT